MNDRYKDFPLQSLKVSEILLNIYDCSLDETDLFELPTERLAEFILEVFNKGVLDSYLGIKGV